jgi:hypothetical protein
MQEGFVNFGGQNYDPNQIANQTSSAILFIVVTDTSASVRSYVHDMNEISKEVFMQELKACHRKDDILIKGIQFDHEVRNTSGFLPITTLPDDYLTVKAEGVSTSLYDAVYVALEQMIAYRTDLEDQGISVRSCIFIVTDGEDNSSAPGASREITKLVNNLRGNEAWITSFSINMLGVGNGANFRQACKDMGLDPDKCLSEVGATAKDIRAQMGVISQSISSGASQAVTF